jgi:hypothetical protein
MAAINANNEQQISFAQDGATVEVTIGADTVTLLRPVPGGGGISWTYGGRESRTDSDQGVLQPPLMGNNRPTMLTGKFRFTSDTTAQAIEAILLTEGSGGLVQEYTWVIRNPTTRGGAAGIIHTFATCSLVPGSLKVTAGEQFDDIEFELYCRATKPTKATY